MLTLQQAWQIVDDSLQNAVVEAETIRAATAGGRILAADALSPVDLPPFNKATMDGYAIPAGDERARYRVLETVGAGSVPSAPLVPGTTVKVMTGAPVPDGADRVVKIDHARRDGDFVEVLKFGRDRNVCPQGEDVRVGGLVLPAGTRLGPLDVANLIGCGIAEVSVRRRLRLAVLATGNELVDDPAQLTPGKIMNSNGPLLAGLGRQHGMDIVLTATLRDDRQAIGQSIRRAFDAADLVAIAGGISVGDFDFVTAALADCGLTTHFHEVAIKPGRPVTFASGPAAGTARAVFGLPGSPVSVFLMFHLFVLRAAARMTGSPWPLRCVAMPLGLKYRRRRTERQEFVPCRVAEDGSIEPIEFHGSAHLTALAAADGFFVVPIDVGELKAGDPVAFLRIEKGSA